jgi:hypothetical protein
MTVTEAAAYLEQAKVGVSEFVSAEPVDADRAAAMSRVGVSGIFLSELEATEEELWRVVRDLAPRAGLNPIDVLRYKAECRRNIHRRAYPDGE